MIAGTLIAAIRATYSYDHRNFTGATDFGTRSATSLGFVSAKSR
jgi:hypothetical protein